MVHLLVVVVEQNFKDLVEQVEEVLPEEEALYQDLVEEELDKQILVVAVVVEVPVVELLVELVVQV
tara:strand:+ start:546 stop:743 length:198 start_codon:yes stop_codon:yes gene_type:complete